MRVTGATRPVIKRSSSLFPRQGIVRGTSLSPRPGIERSTSLSPRPVIESSSLFPRPGIVRGTSLSPRPGTERPLTAESSSLSLTAESSSLSPRPRIAESSSLSPRLGTAESSSLSPRPGTAGNSSHSPIPTLLADASLNKPSQWSGTGWESFCQHTDCQTDNHFCVCITYKHKFSCNRTVFKIYYSITMIMLNTSSPCLSPPFTPPPPEKKKKTWKRKWVAAIQLNVLTSIHSTTNLTIAKKRCKIKLILISAAQKCAFLYSFFMPTEHTLDMLAMIIFQWPCNPKKRGNIWELVSVQWIWNNSHVQWP